MNKYKWKSKRGHLCTLGDCCDIEIDGETPINCILRHDVLSTYSFSFEASLELVTILPSQHPWARTIGVRLEFALTFPVVQLLPWELLWACFPLDARNAPHWVLITRTRTTHQTDIPGQTQWLLHKQLLERVSPYLKMLQTSGCKPYPLMLHVPDPGLAENPGPEEQVLLTVQLTLLPCRLPQSLGEALLTCLTLIPT